MVVVLHLGIFDVRTKNNTQRTFINNKSERFSLQLIASRPNWRHILLDPDSSASGKTVAQLNLKSKYVEDFW